MTTTQSADYTINRYELSEIGVSAHPDLRHIKIETRIWNGKRDPWTHLKYYLLVGAELIDRKEYNADVLNVNRPEELTMRFIVDGAQMLIKALERKNESLKKAASGIELVGA